MLFKRSLSRIIILANEKLRSVTLQMKPDVLTLTSNNQEHEEAEEFLEAKTEGDSIKIGLNANYVLDVLNYFSGARLDFSLSSAEHSILITPIEDDSYQYILMPMKI